MQFCARTCITASTTEWYAVSQPFRRLEDVDKDYSRDDGFVQFCNFRYIKFTGYSGSLFSNEVIVDFSFIFRFQFQRPLHHFHIRVRSGSCE